MAAAPAPASSSSSPPLTSSPSVPPIRLVPRRWLPVGEGGGDGGRRAKEEGDGDSFTVLQWNILADTLGSPAGLFTRTPPNGAATDWAHRKGRILHEITRWRPDVVTLQEVDHYFDFFEPEMRRLGYSGAFVKKPLNHDGSATFVRDSKFTILSVSSFNYWDEKPPRHHHQQQQHQHDSKPEATPANQVALSVLLRLKRQEDSSGSASANASGRKRARVDACGGDGEDGEDGEGGGAVDVLVVNTHLKAAKTPWGEKMRASQARQLVAKIRAQRDAYRASRGQELPVVLCGDLNARPPAAGNLAAAAAADGRDDDGNADYHDHYAAEAVPAVLEADMGGGGARFASCYDLRDPTLFTTWKFRPKGSKPPPLTATTMAALAQQEEQQHQRQQEGEEAAPVREESEVRHCIDYVFLLNPPAPAAQRPPQLAVTHLLSMPTPEAIGPQGLPCVAYPSDHLAVGARIRVVAWPRPGEDEGEG